MPFHVLALSGSLRAASSNTGLLRMAQRLAPDELTIEIYEGLDRLPFYDQDLDTEAPHPEVARFRAAMGAADAILLAAPEYNYSASGVLENAIDWASRPFGQGAIMGTVVSVMTSGGKGGGRKVQAYLHEILGLFRNTLVTEPEIALASGAERITADGTTADPSIETLVADRLANLLATLKGL